MAKRRRPSGQRPSGGSVPSLPPAIRQGIAEALLDGEAEAAIARRLTDSGLPESRVEAEIRRAAAHPYIAGAALLQSRLRKHEWLLRSYGKLSAVRTSAKTIPRIRGISPDRFFADFYAANLPLVLEGIADSWPAMDSWSLDEFERRLGDAPVSLQANRDTANDYEIEKTRHRETSPFRDVIARLREECGTNDFYITAGNSDLNKRSLAPLWEDVGDIPDILEKTEDRDGFFWMGPKGTVTPFHHDLTNNLLVQIAGRKRVMMVPSWETPAMRNHLHCYSEWQSEDFAAGVTVVGRPEPWVCTIGPGDGLFLPVGWWHHVEGLDLTIGMSFTNFARANDFYSDYDSYQRL